MIRSRKPRDKFYSRSSLISYSLFTSAPCPCYAPWINFAAVASGSAVCYLYYSAQRRVVYGHWLSLDVQR
jgi:hypothetical protein